MKNSLQNSRTKTNVVITHHAPSIKSIPEKFRNDILSSAYASNLEDFIIEYKPNYWIHGHIHEPIEYKIGNTTVLCNPCGYINESFNGHDKNFTINICA